MAVLVLLLAVSLLLTGCSDDPPATLPDCAAALPVPGGVELVEVTVEPSEENPTCAVTFASDAPVDEVVESWQALLDGEGVAHDARHQPGAQAVIRLDGPVCGSVLVFAAGTERVTDAVPADRTPVLASLIDCPRE